MLKTRASQLGHPLVVSYFTPGTHYETLARCLERSCRRLGLAYRIEPRAARASWVENCAQKALFIREMHIAEGRPLLWVDADGMLQRPIEAVRSATTDLSLVRRDGWSFYGGQVYFGAGDGARAILDRWCAYCESAPHVWDQVSLGYAWWDVLLERSLQTLWLPERVSAKLSRNPAARLFQRVFSPASVLHQQESRRSKGTQMRPERSEFTTYDLPFWWKEAARHERPFPLHAAQLTELGLSASTDRRPSFG